MKKIEKEEEDDLRPEYDFSRIKGGVRGKYADRYREGTNLVLVEIIPRPSFRPPRQTAEASAFHSFRLKVILGSRYSALRKRTRILSLDPQARLDRHPSYPARAVRRRCQTRSVQQALFRQRQPDVPPEPDLELRLR
jgi:hypothetical protein